MSSPSHPTRIAVIGSGIAGLSAAWLLSASHHVTLYEQSATLGGHTHTIDVTLDGITHPVDTGFLVFNRATYPNLCQLFEILGVTTVPSAMSFSVRIAPRKLEWSGENLATVFAQKSNLLRPGFWRLVRDVQRFNRTALGEMGTGVDLADYLRSGGYSNEFRDWYLLPMAGAIWSCPTDTMLRFPAATLIRFFHNHGLLRVTDHPQWYTVAGGGRQYVERMRSAISATRCNAQVIGLQRADSHVSVRTRTSTERHDYAVLACHSDQALKLLADPSPDEARVLGAIGYQANPALVHTDQSFLPQRRPLWSAWNYHLEGKAREGIGVSYYINKLQPLPFSRPVIVTLNAARAPRAGTLLHQLTFEHPIFDRAALEAQTLLPGIQGQRRTWFCGAWTRYGFHEDGLLSGMDVAHRLGASLPWRTGASA